MMTIIARILEIMAAKNIKATQLTADLGLSKNIVSEWKNGRIKPSIDIIVKLSEYFNISTDYILTGTENKQIQQLTENETELLHIFSQFSDREQIKIIGQLENELKHNVSPSEYHEQVQTFDVKIAAKGGGISSQQIKMTPSELEKWIEEQKKFSK